MLFYFKKRTIYPLLSTIVGLITKIADLQKLQVKAAAKRFTILFLQKPLNQLTLLNLHYNILLTNFIIIIMRKFLKYFSSYLTLLIKIFTSYSLNYLMILMIKGPFTYLYVNTINSRKHSCRNTSSYLLVKVVSLDLEQNENFCCCKCICTKIIVISLSIIL